MSLCSHFVSLLVCHSSFFCRESFWWFYVIFAAVFHLLVVLFCAFYSFLSVYSVFMFLSGHFQSLLDWHVSLLARVNMSLKEPTRKKLNKTKNKCCLMTID